MTDPAEMWTVLGERYNPHSQTILLQRIRKFMNVRMEEDDNGMEQHLQKVQRPVYNSVLLNSVPEDYKVAISILEAQADLTPTVW